MKLLVVKEEGFISAAMFRKLAWGEAKNTLEYLTNPEIEQILEFLAKCHPDGIFKESLNGIFSFGRDFIAELLSFNSFQEIIERR